MKILLKLDRSLALWLNSKEQIIETPILADNTVVIDTDDCNVVIVGFSDMCQQEHDEIVAQLKSA